MSFRVHSLFFSQVWLGCIVLLENLSCMMIQPFIGAGMLFSIFRSSVLRGGSILLESHPFHNVTVFHRSYLKINMVFHRIISICACH